MMPELLLDTNPGPSPQLITQETETAAEAPRRAKGMFVFWGSDWPEEALRAYPRKYDLTATELGHSVIFGESNTDCKSIIAQSFQELELEKLSNILNEFEVADYSATLQFVIKYPKVARLLKHVRRTINKYFGDSDVSLVPKTDPEIGTQEMWMYIHTDLPVPEAMNILESFDSDYFINIWERSNQKLCLDLLFT